MKLLIIFLIGAVIGFLLLSVFLRLSKTYIGKYDTSDEVLYKGMCSYEGNFYIMYSYIGKKGIFIMSKDDFDTYYQPKYNV